MPRTGGERHVVIRGDRLSVWKNDRCIVSVKVDPNSLRLAAADNHADWEKRGEDN